MRTYRAGLMAEAVVMTRAATEAVRRDCIVKHVSVSLFKSSMADAISLSLTLFVISRRIFLQDDSSFVRTKHRWRKSDTSSTREYGRREL